MNCKEAAFNTVKVELINHASCFQINVFYIETISKKQLNQLLKLRNTASCS